MPELAYAKNAAIEDMQWCPQARATVFMSANGVCPWCRTDHSAASRLNEREMAGMRLLAAGMGRKQIAPALACSETTVANDWRNIRMKLSAKTTAHALVMLVKEGSV